MKKIQNQNAATKIGHVIGEITKMAIFFFVGSNLVDPSIWSYVLFVLAGLTLIVNLVFAQSFGVVVISTANKILMVSAGLAWIGYFSNSANLFLLVLGAIVALIYAISAYKA